MIRPATPEDAHAIGRLLDDAIVESGANAPQHLIEQMARTTFLALVSTEQTLVVGTIVGQIVMEEAEIHDVAIAAQFRRQGKATRLVQAFEDHAARKGAQQSFLEVRSSNAPAIRLYEEAGYEAQGSRRGYYSNGEDAVVMRKALVPNP